MSDQPTNGDEDQDQRRKLHRHWGHQPWGFEAMDRIDRIKFGQRGFLRPKIIQLLEGQPMNGVDIMSKVEEMSHGWYRPSPGAIYPLLEQLEKEGMIAKNKGGKFELTAAYAEQTGMRGNLGGALSAMESNASYIEDLQKNDPSSLSKYKERIAKLASRLDALNDALQSGSGR
jgi:DNA-binding PadR family transcriptional regulator